MADNASGGVFRAAVCAVALALVAGASARPALAAATFPDIPVWANPGAWQDSSRLVDDRGILIYKNRCIGSFKAPLAESLRNEPRAVTVRFLRDRRTELRSDFGGYRIYRMTNSPDSSKAMLLRRYSINAGSDLTWSFSRVTRTSGISLFPGLGNGAFGTRRDIPSGVLPRAISLADVNSDGKTDIVSVNEFSNSLSIYSGPGFQNRLDLPAGQVPTGVGIGDWNGDGKPDLAIASSATNGISLYKSLPSNVFGAPVDSVTGADPQAIAFADMNGDVFKDLIILHRGSNQVMVILGRSNGFLTDRTTAATGPNPTLLAVGDLNGDARTDAIVGNQGDDTASLFLNNGIGSLVPAGTFSIGPAASAMALGDLDGDNDLDLVVTNRLGGTVSVFLGNGTGGFGAPTDYPTGTGPSGVAIGDVNNDTRPDVVVTNQSENTVSVLLGDGAGNLGTKTDLASEVGPRGVAIGDLDGDNIADLAVANYSYQLPYLCNGAVVNDSVATYVDPDSAGQFVKICRRPGVLGARCDSPGDSIFVLDAPPGPHDGFQTWYSITIERRNTTDPDYEDLFVPDLANCTNPLDPRTCVNLNNKLHNIAVPVEPTRGPTANLEDVLVVPNPYRGTEVWDKPGQGEIHFINLPSQAKIRIYTAAGDLVRELQHSDTVRDFERWDLKNASGHAVASGIYMYRIEAGTFHFQNRFVVIR